MTNFPIPVAVFLALILPACATGEQLEYVGESSYLLKESALPGGAEVSYHLQVRAADSAKVVVQTEREEPYSEVGMEVAELDRERARKLGDHALSGLLVKAVGEGSPAAAAGIEVGEILVRVAGKRVVFLEAFGDVVAVLPAGKASEFQLRACGDPEGDLRTVQVVPVVEMRRRSDIEDIPLVGVESRNPVAYLGVSLRSFPPAQTEAVFGHKRPVSVVTGVVLGSPAYRAGLRAGDIILRVDGAEAPGPEGLMTLLRSKGPRAEKIDVEVRSKYGDYTAQIELDDYAGATQTYLPLGWFTRVSAKRTQWNVALGGWLVGYDNSYLPTRNRQTAERGHLTALVGLFRREWSPSGTSTRLLWFIKIEN